MSPDPTSAQPGRAEAAAPSARSSGTSRSAVFDAIRRAGSTSRAELADLTGFTAGAVTHAVRALLAEGLVVETGDVARTKGKPRVMLSLAPRARCAVGVQLEADWAVIAVADATGRLLARQRVRGARSAAPEAVVDRIAAHVTGLLRAAGVTERAALGMGLVLPGTLDVERGALVRSPSLEAWVGVEVRERFERATGLRVELGNDATAAAQGELWNGAVAGSTAHGTLCMGASIGLGLVLGGDVYRGATSNAGSLGALEAAPTDAGERRTLAQLAGPAAVAAAAREAAGRAGAEALGLSAEHDPFADFAAISSAAVRGNALAARLVETSAERLADAVVPVVRLLDLDSLSLTGPSFAVAGSIYLDVLRRRLAAEGTGSGVRVRLSMQAPDAAAVGAAALVLGAAMPALAEDAPWHREPARG